MKKAKRGAAMIYTLQIVLIITKGETTQTRNLTSLKSINLASCVEIITINGKNR